MTQRQRHGLGDELPASYRGGPGSIRGKSVRFAVNKVAVQNVFLRERPPVAMCVYSSTDPPDVLIHQQSTLHNLG